MGDRHVGATHPNPKRPSDQSFCFLFSEVICFRQHFSAVQLMHQWTQQKASVLFYLARRISAQRGFSVQPQLLMISKITVNAVISQTCFNTLPTSTLTRPGVERRGAHY